MTDTAMTGMLTEDQFLEHSAIVAGLTDEEYLEHYGKKGMKWGQKMAESQLGVAAKARGALGVGLTRKENRGARNAAIDAARGRNADGTNKRAVQEAKIAYKAAKKTDGKAAAKAALRATRDKRADDVHDARLAKSGKEAVGIALLSAAAIAIAVTS